MSRIFVPLVRLRIYNVVLNTCLEKRRFGSLSKALDLLDLIVRDTDCSRIIVGWSISKVGWTDHFPHIDMFTDIIDIETKNTMDLANGEVPQLKIKVLEILDRVVKCNSGQTEKIIQQTQLIAKIIHSIQTLVELSREIHHKRTAGLIWQERDIQTTNLLNRHPSSPGASSSSAIIVPKTEPFGPGSGEVNLAGLFSSPAQPKSFQQRQESPAIHQKHFNVAPTPAPISPPLTSTSPLSPPKVLFTSFQENYSDNVHYKPLGLDKFDNEGGMGSRQIMQFLYPDNRVFDFIVLLKLELEFILGIIHTLPDYHTFLFNREPSEYRALAFAVSKIVVCDLGLPTEAQELALEVLGIMVIHDEEEPYYLNLVREMYGIA
ncbi:hypothetical protein BGZ76_009461 [Entomortierella beljakovae]|nr:hypothetical protein BGZ76_009461 [Entomortierella beljakovae]